VFSDEVEKIDKIMNDAQSEIEKMVNIAFLFIVESY
jgi:hypothetical protein